MKTDKDKIYDLRIRINTIADMINTLKNEKEYYESFLQVLEKKKS